MAENREKTTTSVIVGTLVFMCAIAAAVVTVSAPVERILGEGAFALRGAFHGLLAGVFMVTATIGLFQAFRLWSGSGAGVRELEVGSALNAAASLLTIVLGNWIYIPYRGAAGPRTFFLEKAPEVHKIFFEFKEFTALFTLPLAAAACFIICRYGERVLKRRFLREASALLLVLVFFYFAVAFGLGAAVTKLRAV